MLKAKKYLGFYLLSFTCSLSSWLGFIVCAIRSVYALRNKNAEYKNIIVIQLGHLGDLILTLPVIKALKEKYPEAEISLLVGPWGESVVKTFAPETHLLIYNSKKYKRGTSDKNKQVPDLSQYDLIVHIRGNFSLIFEYFKNIRAVFISFLSIKNNLKLSFLYHIGLPFKFRKVEHQYEIIRSKLKNIGVPLSERPVLVVKNDWQKNILDVLKDYNIENSKIAVIHPGSPWPHRRWPLINFITLGKHLTKKYGMKVIVIGAQEEVDVCDKLKNKDIINLIGLLDLKQLSALMSLCDIYIGNDSGPAHLAAAVGKPVMAFYGPQEPTVFGALSKKNIWLKGEIYCSPCWQNICPFSANNCMHKISFPAALNSLNMMMEQS